MAHRRSQLFDRRFRRDLPPELASRLSGSGEQTLGPFESARGRLLYRVWRIEPARRDEPTRAAVTNRLFDEWLAARRRAAKIEWNEPPRS